MSSLRKRLATGRGDRRARVRLKPRRQRRLGLLLALALPALVRSDQ
jgi:hypothetical protein